MITKKNDYIKSPLNYTGNKYRILDQISKKFPNKINVMVDMFCGGATVGLNIPANKIYFVDSNEKVINLLIYLSKQKFDIFMQQLELEIEKYNLSFSYKYGYKRYRQQCSNKNDNNGLKEYNTQGYYKLRDYYNGLINKNTDEANKLLYLLMVYAFNNDIRFNSAGDFNLPVGKTDLNKMNVNKIKQYIDRINNIDAIFICAKFNDKKVKNIIQEADFVYMDPPYLVGDAVYNMSWNYESEYELLDFIDELISKNKKFALSNVMSKIGKINEPLSYWCYKNKTLIDVTHIDYNYRSASYNKIKRDAKEDEILVTLKDKYED